MFRYDAVIAKNGYTIVTIHQK